MLTPAHLTRALPWAARIGWIGVGWLGSEALSDAVAGRSTAIAWTASLVAATLWLAAVAALVVGSVTTLTLARVVVPVGVVAAPIANAGGASTTDCVALGAVALVTAMLVSSAEFGRAYVQASAYGDELRFPLRPPPAYLLAATVAWVVAAGGLAAGPLVLAGGRPIAGLLLMALAGVAVFAWPRWHRLARRWLVIVPAGIVVHDHLVLAETLMLRRTEIDAIELARVGTQAADLTGPASGHALQIDTTGPETATLAATPRVPRGTVIHLTACLVTPTRPGAALRALADRRFPVR